MNVSLFVPREWDDVDYRFLAAYGGDPEPLADLREIASLHRVVPIPLDRKAPRDKGWNTRIYSTAEIELRLASGNHLGILLGANGLVDIEGDGPEAERFFAELTAGVEMPPTPTWDSARGRHRLYKLPASAAADAKLSPYYGPKGQLEIRTGAKQSILPHPDNGRRWVGPPLSADFEPAELPQAVVDRLMAAASANPGDDGRVQEQVDKVIEWLDANGIRWTGTESKETFTVIDLESCPFKGQSDGNTGILIDHETGHLGVNCFHAKCQHKTFADLEATAAIPFGGRRVIFIAPPEHALVEQAVSSLRDVPNLYQRGTDLVRIVPSSAPPEGIIRRADAPTVQPVSLAGLQEILSRAAEYYRRNRKSVSRDYVPGYVVKLADARYDFPVPRIVAVVSSPVLRADGSVLSAPGYDAATQLYLAGGFELPELTIDEARQALEYVVIDFPFATEADKAAFLAALLTPLARQAYQGPSPLFLIEANVPGAGKSLAADVISHIVAGREMSRMTAPDNDEEWRKRITSIVMSGEQLVLIDNIAGKLASASLDSMLTGTTWSDRVLGKSETVIAPIVHATYATANNIDTGGDLVRRTLPIRLQSPLESPEKRDDFHEDDLLGYVQRNRDLLLAAALAILRHYIVAGRPDLNLPGWGSYQGWSNIVRSALVFAGYADPVETRAQFAEQADENGALLRLLAQGWDELDPTGDGLQVRDAYARREESPAMLEALDLMPASRDPKVQLGNILKSFRGRVIAGRSFASRLGRRKVQVWYLSRGERRDVS